MAFVCYKQASDVTQLLNVSTALLWSTVPWPFLSCRHLHVSCFVTLSQAMKPVAKQFQDSGRASFTPHYVTWACTEGETAFNRAVIESVAT